MKKMLLALVASCAACVSGCGTVCNVVSGDCYPYGGVERDFALFAGSSIGDGVDGKGLLALLLLGSTEVLASFVGDTLTLHFTQRVHPGEPYNSVNGHNDEDNLPAGPHKTEPVLVIYREPDAPDETAVPKQ